MSEATTGKYQCAVCLQWISGPSWQHVCAGSAPTTGGLTGWTCQRCGANVPNGVLHSCGGATISNIVKTANPSGWECPRCRVVHAPWVQSCSCPTGTIPYAPPDPPPPKADWCARCGMPNRGWGPAASLCLQCFEAEKNCYPQQGTFTDEAERKPDSSYCDHCGVIFVGLRGPGEKVFCSDCAALKGPA